MFKVIPFKSELYSTEFWHHFKTDVSICSLKETSDGKFDIKIDGVSHTSWFRHKKDGFMEVSGLSKLKVNI